MTNILNLFKFIESKRSEYKLPDEVRLVHDTNPIELNGSISLFDSPLTTLPDNLTVNGTLIISPKIKSLPDNLTVTNILSISHMDTLSIPNNLNVGSLEVYNRSITNQHTKDDIRAMIEKNGGTVNKITGYFWN